MQKHSGQTPAFRGPKGELIPDSIAEIKYLRLGGVNQWVMIRGENIKNPLVILLHGGPGLSDTSFFRYFNAALEKDFTFVYWDQRGTGKSFDRNLSKSSMTVEQFINDLDELCDAVRKQMGQSKVLILGHSWGSALGTLYADRFPEKVATYVGIAQVGDSATGEALSYAFGISEAQRLRKRTALRKLRAIGPPPHTSDQMWVERSWVSILEGRASPRAAWQMAQIFLGGTESSIFDLPDALRGFRFSISAMWDEVSRLNLLKTVPSLKMPVFFFLGRKDHWIPAEASEAYFHALSAPFKKLVWFEESGHEPFMDEAARFNAAMVELVRPVAIAAMTPQPTRH